MSDKMVERKEWNEFRAIGLLGYINMILHMFGWAICVDYEDKECTKVKGCFPARVKFRGMDDKGQDKIYTNVTKYLKDNINELEKEIE